MSKTPFSGSAITEAVVLFRNFRSFYLAKNQNGDAAIFRKGLGQLSVFILRAKSSTTFVLQSLS